MFGSYLESQADWSVKVGDTIMPNWLLDRVIPSAGNEKGLGRIIYAAQYGTTLILLAPIFIASPVLKPLADMSLGTFRTSRNALLSVQKVLSGNGSKIDDTYHK